MTSSRDGRTRAERTLPVGALLAVLLALPPVVPAAEAQDNQGFIYGRVVTESGTEYVGFLRWGTQEAFWDDLFHSVKVELPSFEYLDVQEADQLRGRRESRVRVLNREVRIEYPSSRQFVTRFGDIASIEPGRRGRTRVVMKTGTEYGVEGGSDDVSDAIHVKDAGLGEIDLRWDRIESIEFGAAPRDADPGAFRLYGTVETRDGVFEGFIQWDKDECLSTDVLDGDTEDGDVQIRMGAIESIERWSRQASLVVLKDGREMRLEGSNDVNESNRGIMIEDPRFGRVTVHWDSFERVTFSDPPGSGRAYDDYAPMGELRGTVTDTDGARLSGRIVFDLDEAEGWEMLNGDLDGNNYDIPFANVASVEPLRGAARVTLRSGETLVLEDTQDVGSSNSGILVFEGPDPMYVRWRDVERIEFGG